MKTLTQKDLQILISFFEDDDPKVVSIAEEQLRQHAEQAIPMLKDAIAKVNPGVRKLAKLWLRNYQWEALEEEFKELSAREEKRFDLEDGAFLLARFANPDINVAHYTKILDDMAFELALRIYSKDEPKTIVKKVNDFLMKEHGFLGNKGNYYDPDNSYINKVLDRRTGIPISLTSIYVYLARRLHLPMYGVGMPGHYLVKYESKDAEIYIDPFEKGKVMSRLDCMRYLLNAGYGFKESFLTRAKPRDALKRMINNLIMIYDQQGMMDHEKQLVRYFEILNNYRTKK